MQLLLLLVQTVDQLPEGPEPADVKAGWTAFAVFLLLVGATALLGFSLVKHLGKAQAAKDAGVFGPVDDDQPREDRADPRAD